MERGQKIQDRGKMRNVRKKREQCNESAKKSPKMSRKTAKRRIMSGSMLLGVICFVALVLYFTGSPELVKEIKKITLGFIGGCTIILWSSMKKWTEMGSIGQVMRAAMSRIIVWIALMVFLSSGIICLASTYRIVRDEEKEREKKKTVEQNIPEDEEGEDAPERNDTVFSWINDIYIENLSVYYDGEIKKEDEDRYRLELITEEITSQKQADKPLDSENKDYDVYILAANQYYNLYKTAVENGDMAEVRKSMLNSAINARITANQYKQTPLNLQVLGQTRIDIALVEREMKENKWHIRYEEALKDYIAGLNCALINQDTLKAEELWDSINETYTEISKFTAQDETMSEKANKMKNVCGADIPCLTKNKP